MLDPDAPGTTATSSRTTTSANHSVIEMMNAAARTSPISSCMSAPTSTTRNAT
jgi:hypothetical protein